MKHYGDIKQLSGYELEPVDIITGGSPCQDLSVAGKREGLSGVRSGLFMEQIRIIKEMRERDRADGRADEHIRPRFMVWENVPGAFSSNGGKDFQRVLTEIVRIVEPTAPAVPLPCERWSKAGCLYGDMETWSIAWRVHDAQFWGVPQRRKRIALVADFGGLSAPEILFEREGVSGNIEPCEKEREKVTGGAGESLNPAVARSLTARQDGSYDSDRGPDVIVYGISAYESYAMKSDNPAAGIYEADTARTLDVNGGNPACNQGGIVVVDRQTDRQTDRQINP